MSASMELLEREIEKRTEERRVEAAPASYEEQEHRRLMSESMRKLLEPQEDTRFDRYTPPANPAVRTYDTETAALRSDHVPAYQSPEAAVSEYHPPVVPTVAGAPSAAQRIADYVPVTLGMQSVVRFADMPQSYAPAAAPEAPARQESEKRAGLFENLLYQNGELLDTSVEAPVGETAHIYAPIYSPSYMPEDVPEPETENAAAVGAEEGEDALPTKRTMESVRHAEDNAERQEAGFLSALSLKTKLVLAAVTAVIIILLAAICVNTAILNSLNANVTARQSDLDRLTETYTGIVEEITDLTSPDNIDQWAFEHGMTR